MKATHKHFNMNKSTRTLRGQRGFFTVAVGLGLLALFGATSSVIVSTNKGEQEVAAVSHQSVDAQGIKTASTVH